MELGYKVTGVDSSQAMLEIARRRRGSSELIQSDVQSFQRNNVFDAGVCLFDSLNVMSMDGLSIVLSNICQSLKWVGALGLISIRRRNTCAHGMVSFLLETRGLVFEW